MTLEWMCYSRVARPGGPVALVHSVRGDRQHSDNVTENASFEVMATQEQGADHHCFPHLLISPKDRWLLFNESITVYTKPLLLPDHFWFAVNIWRP